MPKTSAGLLMFQRKPELRVFLVHPGGPFFRNKDNGAWSIPKGLIEEDEDRLEAAGREFEEETGIKPEAQDFIPLGKIKQKGGKTVFSWAFESRFSKNPEIKSNLFTMEWPPKSGQQQSFPEVDRAEFFDLETAKQKINTAQREFLERLKQNV